MGLYKLREWVGTVTGKGVRWGRDRLGRSAPAFLSANIFALPPPTCTARREAGRHPLAAAVFAARPANCGPFVCFEACAGRRIRELCPPAVPVLRAVCLLPFFACHAHCPSQHLAPAQFALPRSVQVLLCLPTCSFPCAPGSTSRYTNMFASCKTVLLAAATRACSGGPCTGPFVDSSAYLFSCRVHDPGPWV